MNKILKKTLTAVVVIAVVVGAVVAYHSYKINNAPFVEVGALGSHCGEWVRVSGIVKQVLNAQSYAITGSGDFLGVEIATPAALVLATKEQLVRHRTPSLGDNVEVRGLAMCEDRISSAKGVSIMENDFKNFTELLRAKMR